MGSQVPGDSQRVPDDQVLTGALGPRFDAHQSFMERATGPELGLVPEWRFHATRRDGPGRQRAGRHSRTGPIPEDALRIGRVGPNVSAARSVLSFGECPRPW